MNKNEFLKKLEDALSSGMTSVEVAEQINYYDDYISNEVKNGKNENDVLVELGDPTLIAKTIKQVSTTSSNNDYNSNNNYSDNYTSDSENQNSNTTYGRVYDKTGLGCSLIAIILLIVFFAIFTLIGGIFRTFFFVSPISVIILFLLIYYLFFGKNKK